MEVKKYTTCNRSLKDHEEYCLPSDINGLIADHKAVVETMQKTLDVTLIAHRKVYEENKLLQNKIEELEKLDKSMRSCDNCAGDLFVTPDSCELCIDASRWIAKGIK